MTRCSHCGREPNPATLKVTGGLCMPCYKASHQGLTPRQFRRVQGRGELGLLSTMKELGAPYPATLRWDDQLMALDSFVAATLSSYLTHGDLSPERWLELHRARAQLLGICPRDLVSDRYRLRLIAAVDALLSVEGPTRPENGEFHPKRRG